MVLKMPMEREKDSTEKQELNIERVKIVGALLSALDGINLQEEPDQDIMCTKMIPTQEGVDAIGIIVDTTDMDPVQATAVVPVTTRSQTAMRVSLVLPRIPVP